MHVETSLSDAQDEDPGENNELYEVTNDTEAAEGVLNAHHTAKIDIVIDTHCIEHGFFIYKGDSPENYAACSLLEVSVLYNLSVSIPHPLNRSRGTLSKKGYLNTTSPHNPQVLHIECVTGPTEYVAPFGPGRARHTEWVDENSNVKLVFKVSIQYVNHK